MTRSRWLPSPSLTVFLTLLWLLLNNTLSFAHLVLGLFLGWAIPVLCREFLMDVPEVRSPIKLIRFFLRVLGDIAIANLQVAKLVLGPRHKLRPAFVEVPMEIENELVLALLTSILSLTPGTVSAALSPDRKTLLIHALDAPEPEKLAAEVKTRYEAPLLEIFQCSTP